MKKLLSLVIFTLLTLTSTLHAQCGADFSIDSTICPTITFTDNSTSVGNITSWSWDFGDGNTANSNFVSHNYAANGTYNVCLTITTDSNCTDQYCYPLVINCMGASCQADFTWAYASTGCPDVDFSDQSLAGGGTLVNWTWDFGDGDSDNSASPTHSYASDGSYVVCLTIDANPGCTDTYCDTVNISCGSDPPLDTIPGFFVSQIDFSYDQAPFQENSACGLLAIDIQEFTSQMGISQGFLNMETDQGWVVRNLPVDANSGMPGISVMFNLGTYSQVDSLELGIDFTSSPVTSFGAPLDSMIFVSSVENNAEGLDSARTDTVSWQIDHSMIAFSGSGMTELIWQNPQRRNIEQYRRQCGPAAVANSLHWLDSVYGLNLPHPHVQGLGATGSNPSLVGQLDGTMNRPTNFAAKPFNFVRGKVKYLEANGYQNQIQVTHKRRPGYTPFTGDVKANAAQGSMVSYEDSSATSMIDWIIDQVRNGYDVEIFFAWDGGGAHIVDLNGAGRIGGVPFVTFVHDAVQQKPGGTTPEQGGLGFSFVVNNLMQTYAGGKVQAARLDLAISECAGPLAREKEVEMAELIIFPNPNSGKFSLRTGGLPDGPAFLEIFDLQGKLVHSEELLLGQGLPVHELSLEYISSGIYQARLRSAGKILVEKLMIH